MNKEDIKINIVFTSIKLNSKTGKWDVKILDSGKVKWIRGFDNETNAYLSAKSLEALNSKQIK